MITLDRLKRLHLSKKQLDCMIVGIFAPNALYEKISYCKYFQNKV